MIHIIVLNRLFVYTRGSNDGKPGWFWMSLWFRSLTMMMQSPKLKHSPRLTLHHSLPWRNKQPIHNYEPVTGLTTAAVCVSVPWYPSFCVRHICSNIRAVDMIGHKWVLGYYFFFCPVISTRKYVTLVPWAWLVIDWSNKGVDQVHSFLWYQQVWFHFHEYSCSHWLTRLSTVNTVQRTELKQGVEVKHWRESIFHCPFVFKGNQGCIINDVLAHPEQDISFCTNFHGIPSDVYWHVSLKFYFEMKSQRVTKVQTSHPLGDRDCLYTVSP